MKSEHTYIDTEADSEGDDHDCSGEEGADDRVVDEDFLDDDDSDSAWKKDCRRPN